MTSPPSPTENFPLADLTPEPHGGIDLEGLAKMLYLADMADDVLSMPGWEWEEHSPFFQAQYRLQAERLTSDLAAQGMVLVGRETIERIQRTLGVTDDFPGLSVHEIDSDARDELDEAFNSLFAALTSRPEEE